MITMIFLLDSYFTPEKPAYPRNVNPDFLPLSIFRLYSFYSILPQIIHTCDQFQMGIREIFLSFQGGLSKMYRIYMKILNSDEGDFDILVKTGIF